MARVRASSRSRSRPARTGPPGRQVPLSDPHTAAGLWACNNRSVSKKPGRHLALIISFAVAVVLAVLALTAALAQSFAWSGWWVVTVAVVLAVLTFSWKLWIDVVIPWRTSKKDDEVEERHASAVRLDLHANAARVAFSVTNVGTHEVRTVKVIGIAEGGELDPLLALPAFIPSSHGPGVKFTPMPVGDLCIEVTSIFPQTGLALGEFDLSPGKPMARRVDLDVTWLDHGGMRRRSHGIADLNHPGGGANLVPRPLL